MARILVDRVKETTTTTGTGALALGGAVTNFRDFDSVMANTDTTLYAIVHRTSAQWEVGVGTWNTGNTLSRTTVLAGTNGTSAVNLAAGTKDVFMTLTPSGEWPILRLVEGATINWDNGDLVLTQSGNSLTLTGGTLIIGSGADALTINPANGTNVISTAQNLQLNANGGIVGITDESVGFTVPIEVGPGTTTNPPIQLDTASVLMTTPADGAIELDATNMYGTTDAGNRGYIPLKHLIRANATRTYTSNTNSQAIFNSPANGRLTLETGTYRMHGVLSFQAMSATSGNRSFNLLGAGTATVGGVVYIVGGLDATVSTVGAGGFSHNIAVGSTTSAVPAAVGASAIFLIDGSFEVTGAGTIIPSTTMVTAAASTLTIGSFLEIWRIGTDALVSVGQWD